jgi:hypothetical protein
MDIQV